MATSDTPASRLLAGKTLDTPIYFFFGRDAALVDAIVRQAVTLWRRGRTDDAEITRLTAKEVEDDPTALTDFLSAPNLFATPRLLVVSELGERNAKLLAAWLTDRADGPGTIFLSSASLKSRSKMLDRFRQAERAVTVSCYDFDIPPQQIEARLRGDGVGGVEPGAMRVLQLLSRSLDPQSFEMVRRQAALLVDEGETLTEAALAPLLVQGAADAPTDALMVALLTEDRASVLQRLTDLRQAAAAAPATLATLAWSAGACLRALQGGGRAPWTLDKALGEAGRRRADLGLRLETALRAIIEAEERARRAPDLAAADLERLALKVHQLIQSR